MLFNILILHETQQAAPRPECTTDYECSAQLACIREKCQNPCFTHSCGVNAECKVQNHRAICVCLPGYIGNPIAVCEERKTSDFFTYTQSDYFRQTPLYKNFTIIYHVLISHSWLQKRFRVPFNSSLHKQRVPESLHI